jgi:hypothetical protein
MLRIGTADYPRRFASGFFDAETAEKTPRMNSESLITAAKLTLSWKPQFSMIYILYLARPWTRPA